MVSKKKVYSTRHIEKLAEIQSAIFLSLNGVPVRFARKRGTSGSPDHIHIHGQTAFETSVLHPSTPQEIQRLCETVGKMLGKDTHVFVYGDENYKIKTLTLREGKCQPNMSILRTQYDVSSYAKKIIRKIDEEYRQIKVFKKGVLMFYHATSPFDPLSLSTVYSSILSGRGSDYPKLSGILVASPRNALFPLDSPSYFFVENPHSPLYPPAGLEKFWMIPKSKVFVHPIGYFTFLKGKTGWNRLVYPPPHF